jgi:hypothetical protein
LREQPHAGRSRRELARVITRIVRSRNRAGSQGLLAESRAEPGAGSAAATGRAGALSTDANQRAAEEKLSRRLGTKVRITPMKQGGKLEILFYSDAELDNIYSIIMGN